MIGCGVPFGAIVPNQSTTSYPGSVSDTVGRLGSVCQRLGVVTASPLSRPVERCGVTGNRLPMITGTCPDRRSDMAAPVLLYWIATILIFAMLEKSSVAR